MYLENKRVLILGMGITGISSVKAIYNQGAKITITDTKTEEQLFDVLNQLKDIPMERFLGVDDVDLSGIDLVIKSPGIPPRAKIIQKAIGLNIEVITDIEVAYRILKEDNFIAITGTNGKTTCTTLIGEIFKNAGLTTYVVGNIGTGILEKINHTQKDDVFVIECSSFQLEHTTSFKPKIALITNITPDHIDWHGSLENYSNAKMKIFKNQNIDDYLVLNHDDEVLKNIGKEVKSNIIWFSIKEKLTKGIYIEDEYIVINDGEKKEKLMAYDELKILGKHNLENALGCIGVALAMDINLHTIKEVLSTFMGVEHRIEFVATKKGISFYNDSKGTNSDASIKAIEAVKSPIILIAGGYDKGGDFNSLIKAFNGKVKALVLIGQTKDKIKNTALENGFNHIYEANTLEEAIELSYSIGESGDNVLLSPACASWDMFKNYEMRGKIFKDIVRNLVE